jgi:hypothetical protein
MNIFKRPYGDNTTYSQEELSETIQMGLVRCFYYFVKRFGNQKVKENTKTDVEKNSGGGK